MIGIAVKAAVAVASVATSYFWGKEDEKDMARKAKQQAEADMATRAGPMIGEDMQTIPRPVKLDAKFYGAITKVKDGSSVPDDQWMVFLAKDNAFPATLAFYYGECVRLGADQEHLDSVQRTIRRVDEWRSANPDICKVPDARGDKLLG